MAYGETARAQAVELPYKESDLALLVVLPKAGEAVSNLESSLNGDAFDALARSLSPRAVNLALPKFTFAWGRSVKPELSALGISTAFGDQADFRGLSPSSKEPLYVSDVFHKAFVLVDESGTEAAAATGVIVATRALVVTHPIELRVDRPFLLFVRNTKTGAVLFAGRVAKP